MDSTITLNCLVLGDVPPTRHAFIVNIAKTATTDELKDAIKEKKYNSFHDLDATDLVLWKVDIPLDVPNPALHVLESTHNIDIKALHGKELPALRKIGRSFPGELADEHVHVIVERPDSVHPPAYDTLTHESAELNLERMCMVCVDLVLCR